ncbi:LOW QUALITY PROTEIN: uncharacterized protein LOC100446733 [Pongo abelii]|uniref:LOW QUALITY PROTEIN: uncharacterized protein LOC100446733 n=1 Tax=Pongo abelii TaxID=9601 RepID=UPI0030071945
MTVVKVFIVLTPQFLSRDKDQLTKELQQHVKSVTVSCKSPRKLLSHITWLHLPSKGQGENLTHSVDSIKATIWCQPVWETVEGQRRRIAPSAARKALNNWREMAERKAAYKQHSSSGIPISPELFAPMDGASKDSVEGRLYGIDAAILKPGGGKGARDYHLRHEGLIRLLQRSVLPDLIHLQLSVLSDLIHLQLCQSFRTSSTCSYLSSRTSSTSCSCQSSRTSSTSCSCQSSWTSSTCSCQSSGTSSTSCSWWSSGTSSTSCSGRSSGTSSTSCSCWSSGTSSTSCSCRSSGTSSTFCSCRSSGTSSTSCSWWSSRTSSISCTTRSSGTSSTSCSCWSSGTSSTSCSYRSSGTSFTCKLCLSSRTSSTSCTAFPLGHHSPFCSVRPLGPLTTSPLSNLWILSHPFYLGGLWPLNNHLHMNLLGYFNNLHLWSLGLQPPPPPGSPLVHLPPPPLGWPLLSEQLLQDLNQLLYPSWPVRPQPPPPHVPLDMFI